MDPYQLPHNYPVPTVQAGQYILSRIRTRRPREPWACHAISGPGQNRSRGPILAAKTGPGGP